MKPQVAGRPGYHSASLLKNTSTVPSPDTFQSSVGDMKVMESDEKIALLKASIQRPSKRDAFLALISGCCETTESVGHIGPTDKSLLGGFSNPARGFLGSSGRAPLEKSN